MRKVIVNFSGGKDSTVAVLEALKKYPKEEIILCYQDTGAEFKDTDKQVEAIANILDLDLVVLRPKRDWFEQVRHDQMPFTPALRKCTFRLKIDIFTSWLSRYRREHNLDDVVIVSGIRREESASRARLEEWQKNDHGVGWHWRPCLYMSKLEIYERIRAEGLPLHYCYEFSDRCNCWLCIFAPKYSIREYAKMHPEEYEKACLLEDEINKPLLAQFNKINDLFKQGRLL